MFFLLKKKKIIEHIIYLFHTLLIILGAFISIIHTGVNISLKIILYE